jgi:O-antigen/teichoic acid export membrane protein
MIESRDAQHQSKFRFLMHSAISLASTSVLTSLLGFVYWALAARTFTPSEVGQSSTAVSAVNLIVSGTMLGFGTLLVAELPSMGRGRSTLVSTVAAFTGAIAGLVALGCAFVLPIDFLGLPDIHIFGVALLFAATASTQSVGYLVDQALLPLVGGRMQLRRNVVHSVSKLLLLVFAAAALTRFGALAIFSTWLAANVISLVFMATQLMRKYGIRARQLIPAPKALRGMHFDAAKHHGLNVALFVPYYAMPIVANVILGSAEAAYVYSAWSVASFVFYLPMALSTALFASGARDSNTFLMEFRKTFRYSALVCVLAILGIVLAGKPVLHIFGESYAEHSYIPLIVMSFGGLGLVVKDHHVALARMTDTVGREAILVSVLSALEVTGAAVGAARGGLEGLSLGWLAAVSLGTVVFAPKVWRAYHGRVEIPARAAEVEYPEFGTQ